MVLGLNPQQRSDVELRAVFLRQRRQVEPSALRDPERLGHRDRLIDKAPVRRDQVQMGSEAEQRSQAKDRLDRRHAPAADRDTRPSLGR